MKGGLETILPLDTLPDGERGGVAQEAAHSKAHSYVFPNTEVKYISLLFSQVSLVLSCRATWKIISPGLVLLVSASFRVSHPERNAVIQGPMQMSCGRMLRSCP